jgi:hypothetical protein
MPKLGAGSKLLSHIMEGIANHDFESAASKCEVLLTYYNRKELDKILYKYCQDSIPMMVKLGIPPDNFVFVTKKIFKELMVLRKNLL